MNIEDYMEEDAYEIKNLKVENKNLKERNSRLESRNDDLLDRISHLQKENKLLQEKLENK